MPSPIAHLAAGYAVYSVHKLRSEAQSPPRQTDLSTKFIIAAASLLPDADFIPGLLISDFDRFHNTLSNSLLIGIVIAAAIGAMLWLWRRLQFTEWFVLILACYELHVIMDYLSRGRGVMLFWPITATRYQFPVELFYGVKHSDGLFSIYHLWTGFTEGLFVLAILLGVRLLYSRATTFRRQSTNFGENESELI